MKLANIDEGAQILPNTFVISRHEYIILSRDIFSHVTIVIYNPYSICKPIVLRNLKPRDTDVMLVSYSKQ